MTSWNDWRNRCQEEGWRPDGIPSSPANAYGQAFKEAGGWGGFLGTGSVAPQNRQFVSLKEASAWAKRQGVISSINWWKRCKEKGWRPGNIPSDPQKVYGQAFNDAGGWGGFLGTGVVAHTNRQFVSLEEASVWAQEQGVSSKKDWIKRGKEKGWRPANIPRNPYHVYGKAYMEAGGMPGFLGRNTPRKPTSVEVKDQQDLICNSENVLFTPPKLGSLKAGGVSVSDQPESHQSPPLLKKLSKK